MISLLDLINDLDPQINNFKIDDDSSSKNPLKKLDKVMTESFIIKQDLIKVGEIFTPTNFKKNVAYKIKKTLAS